MFREYKGLTAQYRKGEMDPSKMDMPDEPKEDDDSPIFSVDTKKFGSTIYYKKVERKETYSDLPEDFEPIIESIMSTLKEIDQ
jgi:hypothetical protein